MAYFSFKKIGIKAISACVPKNISLNSDLNHILPPDEIDKTINTIGIKEKRFVDDNTCSSDLCFKAAEKLLKDNNIEKESIDILLFLSQTPDYKIPATAPILQHRLGLPETTAAFDLSLGCSGYVYALSTAFAYASIPNIRKVLLLVGETFSKITSEYDKVNFPLYGDAGTATLVEKGDYSETFFELFSDGAGSDAVIIPAGGCRNPTSSINIIIEEKEDGNKRSDHQIFMNGMDVFNFALRRVPKGITNLLAKADKTLNSIDYIVFHQANKFMTDFFVKKLKYNPERVPYCIDKYGNTSSSSIPLTIVSELKDPINSNRINTLMAGFGAGLSWGTVYYEFRNCYISEIIYY